MAGMLSPGDIQNIIQNSMLNPLTQASMNAPYPEQSMIPPPPSPASPMQGGAGMPPMPVAMQNEMIPPEIPQMPQAMGVNQMFQSQQNAPIPELQAQQQNPLGKWGPALNVLGQFAAQIDDAQARANLPADLYLKMKQQKNEMEIANQERLMKSLQLEADIKYKEQSLEIQREQNAISREALLRGGDDPAAIKQTAWYLNATPEQRAIYDRVNKVGVDSVDIGGKQVFVDKVTGNIVGEIDKTLAPGDTPETKQAQAAATEVGKEQGIAKAKLQSMQASYPGLVEVTDKLSKLGKIATYTKAGQVKDEAARQLGMDIPDSAVARTAYISTVDNEVLPLLRETFGAAFTVQEGESLRATLGNVNVSPAEKDAVIAAFIESKDREIKKLQRQTGAEVTGGNGRTPQGIDPAILEFMTPEERALFE